METIRRAFAEFLLTPTLVIFGFLLLAVATYILDESRIAPQRGGSALHRLFADPQASRDFLGVIATSIITVTSITFSLLLLAVQQGAAALTSLVFDQFLRRRTNQFYFGFFIGLALYSLLMLSSINSAHQPVYGAALAGLMTAAALYMLILLIYTTIDQMRPVAIINAIHDHTLVARECQQQLLQGSRRNPKLHTGAWTRVAADRNGFFTRLNLRAIDDAAGRLEPGIEIVITASIGDYVAFGDAIAQIRSNAGVDVATVAPVIRAAVSLEAERDLDTDPAFGIEQLVTIGWTSISIAKSNPHPGLLACWSLRDLLARWLHVEPEFGGGQDGVGSAATPIIYPDNVPEQLIQAFESFAVVASESMQHQTVAEVYQAFAQLFPRLPSPLRQRAEDFLLRSLASLGDHAPTSRLDEALTALADTLTDAGSGRSADAVRAARQQLARSIGRLHSRSNRAAAERMGPFG